MRIRRLNAKISRFYDKSQTVIRQGSGGYVTNNLKASCRPAPLGFGKKIIGNAILYNWSFYLAVQSLVFMTINPLITPLADSHEL